VTTLYAFRPDLRRKKLEILSEQYRPTFMILHGIGGPVFCELMSVGPVTTLYAIRPDVRRRKLETLCEQYRLTFMIRMDRMWDLIFIGPVTTLHALRPNVRNMKFIGVQLYRLTLMILYGVWTNRSRYWDLIFVGPVTTLYAFRPEKTGNL
jgi:hypothetical protein